MRKAVFCMLTGILFLSVISFSLPCVAQEATPLPPHKKFVLDLIRASQEEVLLSNSLIYSWEFDGTDKYELGLVLNKGNQAQQLKRYEELLGGQAADSQTKTIINKDAILVVDLETIYVEAQKRLQNEFNDSGTHLESIRLGYNFPLNGITSEDAFDSARTNLNEGLLKFFGRIRWRQQKAVTENIAQSLTDDIVEGSDAARERFSLLARSEFDIPTVDADFMQIWNLIELKVNEHPSLHNVMYEVFPVHDRNGVVSKYEIYTYYDSQNLEEQKALFSQLLETVHFKSPVEITRELALPYSRMLQDINLYIEGSPELNGCLIRGVRFQSKGYPSMEVEGERLDYTIGINLSGYCISDNQHELLNETVRQVFELNDDWRKFLGDYTYESVPWFRTRAETVVPIASHSYSDQIRAFVEGFYPLRDGIRKLQHAEQYEACEMPELAESSRKEAAELLDRAEKGFIESMALSPNKLEYRYMRVLSLLANGKEERALHHMKQIVERNETLDNYSDSCKSLEPFQGPLRLQLIELETNVRTNTKYTHIGLPSS